MVPAGGWADRVTGGRMSVTASLPAPGAAEPAVPADRAAGDLAVLATSSAAETWLRTYVRVLLVGDLVCAGVGATAAYRYRFGMQRGTTDYVRAHLVLSLLLPGLWVVVVAFSRAYERRFLGTGSEELKRVFNAAVRCTAVLGLVGLVSHFELARRWALVALPLTAAGSLVLRLAVRRWLRRARAAGRCVHRTIVVGHPAAVSSLVEQVRRSADAGLVVVGACTPGGGRALPLTRQQVPVLGRVEDALTAARRVGADTVAVAACTEMDGAALRRLAWQLEGSGLHLLVAPALTDIAGSRIHIRPVSGLPLLHVEEPQLSGGRRVAKSLLDRSVAALGLLLLAPVLLVLAAIVRLTTPGPAFFRQERVGRHGQRFSMIKLRSMHLDAEQRLADLAASNERPEGLLFKMREDPRVTRCGAWLRRYSLDEVPQLVNVLRGQMSLVGPRPPLPSEVERYADDVRRRLLVKPGLTGLWQISGRSDLSWDESVRLDLHYVENWSLALDLMILTKTAAAVVGRHGAY